MNGLRGRTVLALAVQAAALATLLAALAGAVWLDPGAQPRTLVVLDRSLSVPRPAADAALASIVRATRGRTVEVIEFAGRAEPPRSVSDDAVALEAGTDLETSATNLERALGVALAAHAHEPFSNAVVVSDGQSNAGDSERALRNARDAGLPLQWLTVARPQPAAWIAQVRAPARARPGQAIRIEVQLEGQVTRRWLVKAAARDASGAAQSASATADARGSAALDVVAEHGGNLLVDVTLEDADTRETLDTRANAAVVDVADAARVLYLAGTPGPLAGSLTAGGWSMAVEPARRADAYRDRLGGFDAVVLDDVSLADASTPFWRSLVEQVTGRGLGLLVLGGERSFALGGYRDSVLESILPVVSEPAAVDRPASVVFAVDKSGSMGAGSAGVDRLALAQRAVLESVGALRARDSVGVIAFDVEAQVLLPLGPARDAARALAGGWPVRARGGTRLAPVLEAAAAQLESAGGRRVLVLVTDGFVDDVPLDAWRNRLDDLHIETIALAVGPDADSTALARLVGPDRGMVLRVAEAAELPGTMTAGLERQRARVQSGAIAVRQRVPLPFMERGSTLAWPEIAAYAVTRLRPDAAAWIESREGDPLVAVRQAQSGRVVAVTCGLGQWTPLWIRWSSWPDLAGGLVEWVSATPGSGSMALTALDATDGIVVQADLRGAEGWADVASLAVTTPTGRSRTPAMQTVAPGRLRATIDDVEPGPYTLVLSSPLGMQRVVHLRSSRAEESAWGASPAVEQWRRAGLVRPWDPGTVARRRAAAAGGLPHVDRWLLGLALLLFATGVLVDRPPVRI